MANKNEFDLDRKYDGNPRCTLGGLYTSEGEFLAYTLERPWNDGQNRHEIDAILPGRYELKFLSSAHFGRDMIHLLDVPARTEVMVHPANKVEELKGCIALGAVRNGEVLGNSRVVVEQFEDRVRAASTNGGQVFLKVS